MTSGSQSPPVRPPGFAYRDGNRPGKAGATGSGVKQLVLHCEGLPLLKLAERFDTPLYVYSAAMIGARYEAFDAAFRGQPHTVCYSVKANSNLTILRLLARKGCGFDVVWGENSSVSSPPIARPRRKWCSPASEKRARK